MRERHRRQYPDAVLSSLPKISKGQISIEYQYAGQERVRLSGHEFISKLPLDLRQRTHDEMQELPWPDGDQISCIIERLRTDPELRSSLIEALREDLQLISQEAASEATGRLREDLGSLSHQ